MPIETQAFALSQQDYLRLQMRDYMGRIWKFYLPILGLTLFAFIALPLPLALMGLAYLLFVPLYALYMYQRRLDDPLLMPLFFQGYYRFEEAGFQRVMGLRGSESYQWGTYTAVQQRGDAYLFYRKRRVLHVVPFHAFQTSADRERFTALLAAKGLL